MKLGDLDTGRRLLDTEEASARGRVTVPTWRAYVARGLAPKPDAYAGSSPLWLVDTVDTWRKTRPGQGRRTDLV